MTNLFFRTISYGNLTVTESVARACFVPLHSDLRQSYHQKFGVGGRGGWHCRTTYGAP